LLLYRPTGVKRGEQDAPSISFAPQPSFRSQFKADLLVSSAMA
jgi:hypothetical protein